MTRRRRKCRRRALGVGTHYLSNQGHDLPLTWRGPGSDGRSHVPMYVWPQAAEATRVKVTTQSPIAAMVESEQRMRFGQQAASGGAGGPPSPPPKMTLDQAVAAQEQEKKVSRSAVTAEQGRCIIGRPNRSCGDGSPRCHSHVKQVL